LRNLFRTINALISNDLTSDLAIGAADLGLLTSVFLLTFAAVQIAIGVVGQYPVIAYQVAFGANVALQLAALAWFGGHRFRGFLTLVFRFPGNSLASSRNTLQSRKPYQQAAQIGQIDSIAPASKRGIGGSPRWDPPLSRRC
jgi:hypothetical protein